MHTDDLIKALAADAGTRQTPPARALGLALVVAIALAGILFAAFLGPRADIAHALSTWRFQLKLVLTALLLISTVPVLLSLSRPTPTPWRKLALVALAPLALAAAVVLELVVTPPSTWMAHTIGRNWMHCLTLIPLLALMPLAALLITLRQSGAPSSPALAGAIAAVLAGAIAATYYATLCTDDSPLFVATWYTFAISGLAILGAMAGRLFLKW